MKAISVITKGFFECKKRWAALLIFIFFSAVVYAQRSDDDSRVTTEFNYDSREMAWYAQPWIWAIVAAVLILLIAFVSKGYLKRHMEDDSETGTTH
ncbi:hypothetical protein [Desertivirga xinjiangensis]|uniref:hypothetical protein n=1 Tax=Desertivirga xinjiangensis TaxID=539206 RepID=UPI00210C846E|nr:hypothetical protein [Pedobacter xinjiangensis]